ncbi:trans-aconitate 2-methyltransferase [Streptomyces sp. HSG2]|uniref:trans-aconitate 2-methyltransferase n=1 Tax=Streptomyces sp. HSG2 TaxID=2797167 RepID=UPI001905B573|nr:trans-aconitate 2-methyltransferase [Streptomyces sp. HSG2]
MTMPSWNAGRYLRHADHRLRPFTDLIARVPDLPARRDGGPPRVVDLGCGPGNATALLAERWPTAHVTGHDTSPEMLDRARRHAGPTPGGGRIDFALGDLRSWEPAEPCELIVSNAALHWVPDHAGLFDRWTRHLVPGGVLAFQVPGNFEAPSHRLLRELTDTPRWRTRLAGLPTRRDAVLPAVVYLDRLTALGCAADVWETTYAQLLTGEDPVLDWMRGTALRPVLTALDDAPEDREAFLADYRSSLRDAYPPGLHGTPFPFRRVFAVARKPADPV